MNQTITRKSKNYFFFLQSPGGEAVVEEGSGMSEKQNKTKKCMKTLLMMVLI